MSDTLLPRNATLAFLQARDFLLENRCNYCNAYEKFVWPKLDNFNWALDYFDYMARGNKKTALIITGGALPDQQLSFDEIRQRSNQVANFFRSLGIVRGERILVMLGNEVALWETMLAATKIGAVVVPTSKVISADDLMDRLERGGVRHVVASSACQDKFNHLAGKCALILVGGASKGWIGYEGVYDQPTEFTPGDTTASSDPLLLYFTSGTTAKPKLVLHSHYSYPVGHLSTMYWIGIQPTDLHWNISSPGWAKHAWSSFFAPWNAGARILASDGSRFRPGNVLDTLARTGVTTLCAPPTAWRMLIKEDLRKYQVKLREAVSAGEPLNPEIIRQVEERWNVTVRDGYGQTETTALIGNTPGETLKPGSMGRALPGYRLRILNPDGQQVREGELCVDRQKSPSGLMLGYESCARPGDVERDPCNHHTGDMVSIDDDGYISFVGRVDDVFKSSDYRISPFELESLALKHPAVLEAAVVPSPDPIRLVVPKAFITLAPGYAPDAETARSIFSFLKDNSAPYKRIRRLEFTELPKTSSGKIRRAELKETERQRSTDRRSSEYLLQDFE